ncbi:MAG: HAMP domain-containing sensor histidine kinase [Acidobacteriota bacterium]
MLVGRPLRGSTHRLTAWFLGVLLLPAATLVGLGLRLLEQDKALSAQRAMERREAAADRAVRALEQSLAGAEVLVPAGAVRLTVSQAGIQVHPPGRVLWLSAPVRALEAETQPFAEAETLEFRGEGEKALRLYEDLARSPREGVRAGAWLRLARVHRRAGRTAAALEAYDRLASVEKVSIEGMPAALLARRSRCTLLEESRQREAAALRQDLLSGRWTLDRSAWLLAAEQVAGWTGSPLQATAEQQAFAEAADWLWREWHAFPPSGSRTVSAAGQQVTVLWRGSGNQVVALAAAPSLVHRWAGSTATALRETGAVLSLADESGHILFGAQPVSRQGVVQRTPAETRLPWILLVSAGNTGPEDGEFQARRRLLAVGLAAIALFLAAGFYFLWRSVRRELAVARLQTDFVSAVSHEFRTPLTSLRHITELLDEDDEVPRERRKSFYSALARSTQRLHRLVESLLDFARMEGGRRPYDLRRLDAGELAAQVVSEFRKEAGPGGFTIRLDVAPGEHPIEADAEALTHALWNLLDNAVKYSGEGRTVWVAVNGHHDGTAISVRDEGPGIPREEQKEIFRKFVRGERARRQGIKGTGIGLAIVSHIVVAHGGAIELESKEGGGSTFTLVLPRRG